MFGTHTWLYILIAWIICQGCHGCQDYEDSDVGLFYMCIYCDAFAITNGKVCYLEHYPNQKWKWKAIFQCDNGYYLAGRGYGDCEKDLSKLILGFKGEWSLHDGSCEEEPTTTALNTSTRETSQLIENTTDMTDHEQSSMYTMNPRMSKEINTGSYASKGHNIDSSSVNYILVAVPTSAVVLLISGTVCLCAVLIYRRRRLSSTKGKVSYKGATASSTVPNAQCMNCETVDTARTPAAVYLDLQNPRQEVPNAQYLNCEVGDTASNPAAVYIDLQNPRPEVPSAQYINCEVPSTASNPDAVYTDLQNSRADEVNYEMIS